ncbi:hypothetical protein R3P38DRAFT_53663 [Favolaschia claudopus]|uniref:Uncharacterized protein n=1 Tax=Favolaschia claudopus TaxID=2862362 RepID=A0AAW0EH39_9AGAR
MSHLDPPFPSFSLVLSQDGSSSRGIIRYYTWTAVNDHDTIASGSNIAHIIPIYHNPAVAPTAHNPFAKIFDTIRKFLEKMITRVKAITS